MSNTLCTIEATTLENVTGGKTVTSGSSSSNDQLVTSLTGIQDSLKDLKKPATSAFGGNQTNTMLFMMLALNRPQVQPSVVVVPQRRW